MKCWLMLIACLGAVSCSAPTGNFHQVDGRLWRSEQPSMNNVGHLQAQGIEHVVSLRRFHKDDHLAGKIRCTHVPMRAGDLTEDDFLDALVAIGENGEKTLVHCWHGADRTGAVVATYRMVVQGWEKERAIKEMHEDAFGHHADVFPEITTLLRDMDVEKMRKDYAKRCGDHRTTIARNE